MRHAHTHTPPMSLKNARLHNISKDLKYDCKILGLGGSGIVVSLYRAGVARGAFLSRVTGPHSSVY